MSGDCRPEDRDRDAEDLFCADLPTTPRPEIGTVLVTGATGYIGGRIVPELLARGYRVRAMVRGSAPECGENWPSAEIVEADAHDVAALRRALDGVDTAYYLIHSLLLGRKHFHDADITAAANFSRVASAAGVRRIIYLGGLGDVRASLSTHLRSRIQVADRLVDGEVPVTRLRAAVVIGSGSASYEIVKHIVSKLPVIPVPAFGMTRCQPIGIRDVVKYLVGCLECDATTGREFDIGGLDVLTYRRMAEVLARLLGRRRLFVRVPGGGVRFYAFMASFLTPVPAPMTRALMEGLLSDVVVQDEAIRRLVPFTPLSYREAIVRAMTREEQDRIHTRWTHSYPPAHELAIKLHELRGGTRYTAEYAIISEKSSEALFASICRIGGKEGWFAGNWMWRLRGWVDTVLGGVGAARGRRSRTKLQVNDTIDFWRIEDIVQNRRLLLRAEMKLPGRAWLAFGVRGSGDRRRLSVTAYYDTGSLFGKLYWYAFLPFHHYIFTELIRQIEKRS